MTRSDAPSGMQPGDATEPDTDTEAINMSNQTTPAGAPTTTGGKPEKQKKHYAGQQKVIGQPIAYDFDTKKEGGKGAKVAVTFMLKSGEKEGEIFSWFGVLNEENADQFNRCVDALVHCGATDTLDVDANDRLVGFGSKNATLTMGDVKDAKGNISYGVVFVNGGTPMANPLSAKETKSLLGGMAGRLADRAAAKRSGRSTASGGADEPLLDDEGNPIPI